MGRRGRWCLGNLATAYGPAFYLIMRAWVRARSIIAARYVMSIDELRAGGRRGRGRRRQVQRVGEWLVPPGQDAVVLVQDCTGVRSFTGCDGLKARQTLDGSCLSADHPPLTRLHWHPSRRQWHGRARAIRQASAVTAFPKWALENSKGPRTYTLRQSFIPRRSPENNPPRFRAAPPNLAVPPS